MKGTLNPLNILKVRKYRKQNSNIGKFPYSGLEVFMGPQGERENNHRHKNNNRKTRKIP